MHNYLKEKYYFINKLDTNIIKQQDKQTTLIYRNYSDTKIEEKKILNYNALCRRHGIKFIFANDVKLAIKLNLGGVYLPSFNNSFKHLSYSRKKNFTILGSAHNLKEIKIKNKQVVKKIFISSIFKKNKNYLGLNKFNLLTSKINGKYVALGGISKVNLKKLKLTNCIGFAGISFFKKKGL
jgi:thiamine-phosphate pyrophosphorylase